MSYFLYSLLHVVLGLFFILIGLLTFLLPWSETIQALSISFIEKNAFPWNFLGLGFFLIGVAFLGYVFLQSKREHIRLSEKPYEVEISEKVFSDYLTSYFKQLFPHQNIPYEFSFKKNKVKLAIDLPYLPQENRNQILETIEEGVREILNDLLGCKKPLELLASFPKSK